MNNKISKISFLMLLVMVLFIDAVYAKEIKCNYSDGGSNNFSFTINTDSKTISDFPNTSFECTKSVSSWNFEYDTFNGECKGPIYVLVQRSSGLMDCSFSLISGRSDTKYELTGSNEESTDNNIYCVYDDVGPTAKKNSALQLKRVQKSAFDMSGDAKYNRLFITINPDTKTFSGNFADFHNSQNKLSFDRVYDANSNSCVPKLYLIDTMNGTFIDDEDLDYLEEGEKIQTTPSPKPTTPKDIDLGHDIKETCDGILGKDFINFLKDIFKWIKIVVPILVIILGSVDFAGSLLQDDKDAMKKATSKFIKRLVVAVAIFLLTFILTFVLNIFNKITGAGTTICEVGMINLKK